ncbi:TonB-dependent receptor [Sphingomonas sp. dw_22]|uniref:TonB-dependent receptor plug domain-containing protein n=1 Tax=Sphingomonas sp. dw_22 TaxID=2721175 RepID=UPI001BD46AC6|nr:TonB-dependent receptor [Sphingomonas sp. dw_22]
MRYTRHKSTMLATCALMSLAAAYPAFAQTEVPQDQAATAPLPESQEEPSGGDIVVTGSRLAGTALTSSAPVTVLGRDQIDSSGTASVGELLQQLPVASPAASDSAGRGNSGTANVALRGLSAINTLVLINGRRVLANSADGTVDLNSVPFEAIDRVEVLQDGASAIYGSDAIAGVVNLIMRRSFDGLQLKAGSGISSRGDLARYEFSGTFGQKSDDGGYVFTASYRHQDGNLIIDRPISRDINFMDRGGRNFRDTATLNPSFSNIDPANPSKIYILKDGVTRGETLDDFRPYCFPDYGSPCAGGVDDGLNYWQTETSQSEVSQFNLWFSGEHELGDSVKAYVEASLNNRQSYGYIGQRLSMGDYTVSALNPYNPFGRDLRVYKTLSNEQGLGGGARSDVDSTFYRFVAGLEGSFDSNWKWDFSGNYERLHQYTDAGNGVVQSRLRLALGDPAACAAVAGCVPIDVFGAGGSGSITPAMLAFVTAPHYRDVTSEMKALDANISGTLFNLPAGPVGVAIGGEYRTESFQQLQDNAPDYSPQTPNFLPPERKVAEVYGEVSVPLLRDIPLIHSLDLDGAVRYSHYNAFGSTTNPKLGIKWRPIRDLMIRGSWGTGFRAPNFTEANSTQSRSARPVVDPCSGADFASYPGCGGRRAPAIVSAYVTSGGNPDLQPETARTWTAGAVWTPAFAPRLSVTADYFRITKKNIIGTADFNYVALQNAMGVPAFAGAVIRDQDNMLLEVQAVRDNLLEQSIDGIDGSIDYTTAQASWGKLNLRLDATYLNSYKLSPAAGQPAIERVGTYSIALGTLAKFRGNVSATWTLGDLSVNYNMRYVGPVRNEASLLIDGHYLQADDYMQHDLAINYDLESQKSRITLGVENVGDAMPPFLEGNYFNGFDQTTFNSRGRYFYMRLQKNF